ncbi:hypothetical protein [Phenylobacterium aquaticum]|uniref:hypothetical protein n=1 Tax=Phenylobacterium aquaticum TaxID=1763816 RepID=UPI001F5C3A90|nr:hypothetical protein [Phenylobacterium aquaticum]MCI3135492.1 hypothetical protein [Phenylobacterium aquaticum]
MSDKSQAVRRYFGAMLMAIGGLIAVLSGLCSLTFLGFVIWNAVTGGGRTVIADVVQMLTLMLAFGGIPFGVGLGVFFWGRSLRK